jgi:putative peptide zinc metalloprotease protein
VSESLFSPSWYRVAELKPRLRGHARIHRHAYRGEVWYVLQDYLSGRFHRFSPAANQVIGLMDGRRTVHQIWEQAAERLGDDAPTQEEVIRLLAQLHAADVLQSDVTPDSVELFRRYQRQEKMRWKQRLWSPLALRLPLFDPEPILVALLPWVRPWFSWAGFLIWLAIVGAGAVLAGVHWSELTENFVDRVLAPQNLFILWLTYPIVKAFHEFGHAFATKVWGGEVHEIGIMLLVLMPVPYVDASAASAFQQRRRRMVVGAMGIMTELFLAAVALVVWLHADYGLVRSIAYNVMLIGGVSTLLFNGNPLLRFDGYYVLADAIEIPNLAKRANQYLGYLVQRYLFGEEKTTSPATSASERKWFVLYGVASFVYRLFIVFAIILFIAGKFFVVGVLLALWASFTMILLPVTKALKFLFRSPQLERGRPRALGVSVALLGLVVGVLFMVPAPLWTRAEGVVWLPERAILRAGTECFVSGYVTPVDSEVERGQALIHCEDPLLRSRARVLAARQRELEALHAAQWRDDRVAARITLEEIRAVEGDLANVRERIDELMIHSPARGRFVVPRAEDLPGRFVRKGETLGYVLQPSALSVRVAVPQSDAGLVRSRTDAVEVRFANAVPESFPATIEREVPGGTDELPSPVLGTAGGGVIEVDPRHSGGTRTFQKVFDYELALPEDIVGTPVGTRAYVRFDHGTEPLAWQWYRQLRQVFLGRFGV